MNEFREWMQAMGYNGKQVTEAGARIGVGSDIAKALSRGARELTNTERLAMAAAMTGLPAWSLAAAGEIRIVRQAYDLVRSIRESDRTSEPGHSANAA